MTPQLREVLVARFITGESCNLTLSTIPPLEASIQKTIYRIAVLTGQQPTALTSEISAPESLPSVMPGFALGDPATLLRCRPDIRAAERSLAEATARIGVATGDLFPRVTFVGMIEWLRSEI